jgi:methyl-accepting chemotaxis protein-1 (serine sensor receptor)
VYETSVAQSYAQERKAATMLQDFKVQVQEWKNVLLRGKDSAQRERYWTAFQKQERIVVQDASQLLAELPPGPALDKVRAFSQAHERMGAAYRKGYEAFQAADHDHRPETRRCKAWTGSRRSCWTKPQS